MKTQLSQKHILRIVLAPLALALLFLAGCLEQVYVWSPDGKRAAVVNLSKEGLMLCDADGTLSVPLVPDVFRVAWLSDSQRLVLARKHNESKWTPIARVMGQPRAAALVAEAEASWQKFQTGAGWGGVGGVAGLFADRDPDWKLVCIYLRERYGEALHAKLDAGQWDDVAKQTAEIQELVMARIEGEKIVTGTQLYEGIDAISDFRVSPGDKAVAFVAELAQGKSKDGRLWVVPVDASTPQLVAERVAAYPDWTADARSLVYVQASGAASNDDLRLGTLVQREVLDATGKIQLQSEQKSLAGLMFSDQTRVRCLRDGRILFNAAEVNLPLTADDYGDEHEQLFALDPARQATLVRMIPRKRQENLPTGLTFFEVSPGERQVLFGDFTGKIGVLTLATGEVQQVQEPAKDSLQGAPVWRSDGEFTYTRRTPEKDGKKPARAVEVVLRRGEKEKVLSTSWPDAMVNELFSEKN